MFQALRYAFLLSTLLLCSCVTPRYGPLTSSNLHAGGYTDSISAEGVYALKYELTGGVNLVDTIKSHWHQRASELCPQSYDFLYERLDRTLSSAAGQYYYYELVGVVTCSKQSANDV